MERPIAAMLAADSATPPRRIATLVCEGRNPAVVWMGGFRSDMRATKAEALAAWAMADSRRLVRFDYGGHGESEGDFARLTLSDWLDDGQMVVSRLAGPGPVLVGSSMGGWLALLLARRLAGTPQAPSGLVLIAPAVDFTQALMWDRFPPEIRDTISRQGQWLRPSSYAPEPYPITRALIEDGRKHLLLGQPIDPGCPIHILQGMADPDVPWQHVMRLVEDLPQPNLTISLIRDGDHRLSRPEDLAMLIRAVSAMVNAG